jgi:polyphenol oxidase
MPFHHQNSLRYYQFDCFDDSAVTHAVFTRQGGLSPKPWESLNVGASAMVLDDHQRVRNNRILAFNALGRDPDSMYDVWQVHSADVICTQEPRPKEVPHLQADAILTDNPQVTLFMRFADCVPILLHDPIRKVVGLVHSGWPGTVKKIISATISKMTETFDSRPVDIKAAIGPSIAAHHYPVGQDVIDQVHLAFGEYAPDLLPRQADAVQFDLWRANRYLLEQAGVRQIENAGLCTACHLDDWFSHRGEKGKTGRFGALIGLK